MLAKLSQLQLSDNLAFAAYHFQGNKEKVWHYRSIKKLLLKNNETILSHLKALYRSRTFIQAKSDKLLKVLL